MHKGDKGQKASSDAPYQDEGEDDEDDTPIHPSTSSDQLKEVLIAVEKVIFVLSVWNMTNHYTLAS